MDPQKVLSQACFKAISGSSAIRKMFEEGIEMRKIHGDKVMDFTLGNPTLQPPKQFNDALAFLAQNPPANLHSYMPNAGHISCRTALAAALSQWHGVPFTSDMMCMTVGAAGALVTLFRSLCSPGDEVVVLAPFFGEYNAYMSHFDLKAKVCYPDADLNPDMGCLERILSPRTRILIINSPNNPTGHIYPESVLRSIGKLLEKHNATLERPVIVICDEPYRRLVYQGFTCPSIMPIYPYSIVASSFSKDLSLPGERIGFIGVNPHIYSAPLMAGISTSLRQLGYVNAPSLMQFAVERAVNSTIDMEWYQVRRDILYRAIREAGLECVEPRGAFYMFCKVPAGVSESEFLAILKKHLLLAVPGSAFSAPGYFRMAYCVPMVTIESAVPILKVAVDEAKQLVASRTRFLRPPVEEP